MYVDRNMVDQPIFTLANEGGRGVYVPAANTIPAAGPDGLDERPQKHSMWAACWN